MKRTRETIFYNHPEGVRGARTDLSGAVNFDGEDLDSEARKHRNAKIQRDALFAQMEEKKQKIAMEKE